MDEIAASCSAGCHMSPTQRSLAHLKTLGYQARMVMKCNPFAKVRQDVFGGDILALKPGDRIRLSTSCNDLRRRARDSRPERYSMSQDFVGGGSFSQADLR